MLAEVEKNLVKILVKLHGEEVNSTWKFGSGLCVFRKVEINPSCRKKAICWRKGVMMAFYKESVLFQPLESKVKKMEFGINGVQSGVQNLSLQQCFIFAADEEVPLAAM